jgi:hypothetical protein
MGESLTMEDPSARLFFRFGEIGDEGVTERLVVRFVNDRRLKAERFGRAWALEPADVEAFKTLDRPTGYHGHRNRKLAGKNVTKGKPR